MSGATDQTTGEFSSFLSRWKKTKFQQFQLFHRIRPNFDKEQPSNYQDVILYIDSETSLAGLSLLFEWSVTILIRGWGFRVQRLTTNLSTADTFSVNSFYPLIGRTDCKVVAQLGGPPESASHIIVKLAANEMVFVEENAVSVDSDSVDHCFLFLSSAFHCRWIVRREPGTSIECVVTVTESSFCNLLRKHCKQINTTFEPLLFEPL